MWTSFASSLSSDSKKNNDGSLEVGVYCAALPDEEDFNTLPGMVAVATSSVVLIEFPAELSEEVSAGDDALPSFSKNLYDLLSDHHIVKVFCDASGIQRKSIIGSKELSRIPKMECKDVERMCIDQMIYDHDDDTNGINANEIADDGCLPLNKVLKFCTDNRYDKRYTGLVWEEDSPATNGWLNVKTAVRIRKDGNYINFAAGQAYGTLLAYKELLNLRNPDCRPQYIKLDIEKDTQRKSEVERNARLGLDKNGGKRNLILGNQSKKRQRK